MQGLGDKKWSSGVSYGPVLTQTDLYILRQPIELNPILRRDGGAVQLHFSVSGPNLEAALPDGTPVDVATVREEPATLPRVTQMYIICRASPWCTLVKNDNGVTVGDFLTQLVKDYVENFVTDTEMDLLGTSSSRRAQQVRHQAASTAAQVQAQTGWGNYGYSPAVDPASVRPRRCDWLLERQFFENLEHEPRFIQERLNFTAANVFIINLSAY